MPQFSKQSHREVKKMVKRRHDLQALRNVISLRVSDEELELLYRISRKSSKNISEIMREAFTSWQAGQRRLCLDM
jgi:hypothetical protein